MCEAGWIPRKTNHAVQRLVKIMMSPQIQITGHKNLQSINNSEAREWRHDSDKTQTNKLEWRMILKISLRAKAVVSKTLVKRKLRLYFLYFLRNTLILTESRGEFSDQLHSIFRLRALRYYSGQRERKMGSLSNILSSTCTASTDESWSFSRMFRKDNKERFTFRSAHHYLQQTHRPSQYTKTSCNWCFMAIQLEEGFCT